MQWATVTASSPLRIRIDGETADVAVTPDTLTRPLTIGDRVLVTKVDSHLTVVGRKSGDDFALVYVAAAAANRAVNGDGRLNQRGFTSGSSLAAGAYGLDRFKNLGASSLTLTFTGDGFVGRLVTIPTGGRYGTIISRTDMPAGQYAVAWTGTAGVKVYNSGGTVPGSYTSGPGTVVTLDGTANVVVEFGPGTFGELMIVPGTTLVPFAARSFVDELARAQRYYAKSYDLGTAPGTATTTGMVYGSGVGGGTTTGYLTAGLRFPVRMRTSPTITLYDSAGASGKVNREAIGTATYTGNTGTTSALGDAGVFVLSASGTAAGVIGFHFTADAEL